MMLRTRSRWLSALSLSAALSLGFAQVSACGDSGDGDKKAAESLQELGIDDGASEGETISVLVALDKETTLSLKTGAEVKIAAGSTTQKDLEVTLTRPPDSEALAFVKSTDKKLGSAPYVVTPHGKAFDKQVEVTLPLAAQVNADKVQVVYLTDEKDRDWKVVGKPVVSEGRAKIKVDHFSVLMLVEMETTTNPFPNNPGNGGTITRPDAPAGSFTAVLFDKLLECGLIASGGEINYGTEVPEPGSFDACDLACVQQAACDEFSLLWCADSPEGTLGACFTACRSLTYSCGDGESIELAYRCDGFADCVDESDEQGCPPGSIFQCADGTTTYADAECDGYTDCSDGSDEQNCVGKTFTCADGSETLPLSYVCDLVIDCADGSDEPARCLQLTCERRPIDIDPEPEVTPDDTGNP